MNANINCTLKGQYKVDIYSGKQLVETIDWFSNDITNLGMTYPFDYSFARCFMFLSLGDDIHGGVNNNPYTGLKSPISNFKVYNLKTGIHNQSGQYIGWQGYEIGNNHNQSYFRLSSSCGSKLTKNGVNLYRGWSIPTGNFEEDTVIAEPNGLLIKQLMVSPSSGSDIKGNKAFSLVDRDILIPSGYSATITYQLSINFKDYESIQFFSGKKVSGTNGYFETGNAETGISGSEIDLLNSWSNLSGIYRLLFPAIQFVDDIGACVSPKIGYDLEPHVIQNKKTSFYLSPDISHFMVSNSGGIPSSEYEAYNSTGLMGNYSELYEDLVIYSTNRNGAFFGQDANKWFYSGDSIKSSETNENLLLNNIRLYNIPSIANYNSGALLKQNFSYQTVNYLAAKNYPVAFATPGKSGFDYSYSDFGQKAVFSSFLKRFPVNASLYETGVGDFQRLKYVTKKALFPSLYSYGYNSRYGSLVLAYNRSSNVPIENSTFYPYLDFLFFDSEGRASNMAHYRSIPYIYLEDRGSGIGRARFDIVEKITTGLLLTQPSSQNDLLNTDAFNASPANSFNSTNLNSEFLLYGYKDKDGLRSFSLPKSFTGNLRPFLPYSIYFNWDSYQNYDGYYVLIANLTGEGIQSLNLKSGILISNSNATGFNLGVTERNYVEGVGYLQDLTSTYEKYLKDPQNSFKYISGKKPESINRFYSATGFMGNGVSNNFNQSGINISHPRLNNVVAGTNKLSGYLFPGQILNENTLGDVNANNQLGYGSIYGVIADQKFYSYDQDICLLDKPDWTGFGVPNPTGHSSRLFWPTYKNKIGLNIDVGYFLIGSGILEDPDDYFSYGKQIINDIIIKGNHSYNKESFIFSDAKNYFFLSGSGDAKRLGFNNVAANQNFKFRISDINNNFYDINIILKSGLLSNNEIGTIFSGFPSGFSLKERGSGSNFDFDSVISPIKIIGSISGIPQVVADNSTITTTSGSQYKFSGSNNGLSKFALYGYKNINGQKLISDPIFYEITNNQLIDVFNPNPNNNYKMSFSWNSPQNFNYDGYYVLVYDLPKLGISSLNLKSGVIVSSNVNNFTIGDTSISYVENVGPLQDFNNIYNNYLSAANSSITTKEYSLITDCQNLNNYNLGYLYVVPTNFKKPVGHIYHLESGYRILPNYGIGNTGKINTYLPITGGSFPGLSTENAMEMYLTLSWSSQ